MRLEVVVSASLPSSLFGEVSTLFSNRQIETRKLRQDHLTQSLIQRHCSRCIQNKARISLCTAVFLYSLFLHAFVVVSKSQGGKKKLCSPYVDVLFVIFSPNKNAPCHPIPPSHPATPSEKVKSLFLERALELSSFVGGQHMSLAAESIGRDVCGFSVVSP